MNCASARCSCATCERITTNLAPEMRAAASKSRPPSPSPISTWSRGLKSNGRGAPQRRTSTFALSSRPSGTDSCSRLGRPSCHSSRSACTAVSCCSAPARSRVSCSPFAIRGATSVPFPLAMPTALAFALRSARSRSDSICHGLRLSSRARKPCTSSVKPRRARLRATVSGSERNSFGSIIAGTHSN